jgi:hypothetical protein
MEKGQKGKKGEYRIMRIANSGPLGVVRTLYIKPHTAEKDHLPEDKVHMYARAPCPLPSIFGNIPHASNSTAPL